MPIIQSCCCWRSLRKGCYASGAYTMVYFAVTIVTMAHFVEMERRYLSGELAEPESESYLEPEHITPVTVSLNVALLICSAFGFLSCIMMMYGVYKDRKFLMLPWMISMTTETIVDLFNMAYLLYLQTLSFNPITSFLFTLDFFIIVLNVYSMVCVISQFQEYLAGRGTADFDEIDRVGPVQYTASVQPNTTTSSAPSGRRRSGARPTPSRIDPEEPSEAPPLLKAPMASVLSKSNKSAVKKHVQFPDEQSCLESATEIPASEDEDKPESRVISSLWMELETEAPPPER